MSSERLHNNVKEAHHAHSRPDRTPVEQALQSMEQAELQCEKLRKNLGGQGGY